MLLPSFSLSHATPLPGYGPAYLFEQERDMPHGFFGDRDAGHFHDRRPLPPGCGVFGRRSDMPPLRPANGPDRAQDRTQAGVPPEAFKPGFEV